MKIKILILFTLVAFFSSLLRFGNRENNLAVLSDSDYYLDMAQVFAGQKEEFNHQFLESAAHHYNRPLLPFCAGLLGHYVMNDNYSAAFSILNILSAIFIAYLFFVIVIVLYPKINYSWFPSLLFLTAFPQMDFGYHILTETIGLAFAFGTCYLLYNLICQIEKRVFENRQSYFYYKDWRVYLNIFLLFIIQGLSYFTRETAFFLFIFLIYITVKRKLYHWKFLPLVVILFSVFIVAKIPHLIYSQINNTNMPKLPFDLLALINPVYILDTVIKLGLAFNISWLIIVPAIYYLKKGKLTNVHEFIVGWTLAALCYIAAGYLHNTLLNIGYPLRMLFSLFPLFYLVVIEYFEKKYNHPKLGYMLALFFILHVGISVLGVLLDSGTVAVHTIFDFYNVL